MKLTMKNLFIDKIKETRIKRNFTKVSFDVQSLFTNIPIKEGLVLVKQKLQKDKCWTDNTKLNQDDILELLELCLNCTYFKFSNQYYHQTKGSPMGSPVSPIFAEIVLQELEEVKIKPFIQDGTSASYFRYVDDSFCLLNQRKINEVFHNLNDNQLGLVFTMENEQDGKLPFLDTLIYSKEDGKLGHKVYRKPTHTNNYLMYDSFHPNAHKIGVVDTLLTRALRVCDEENLEDEINFVFSTLTKRGYGMGLLRKRLSIVKEREELRKSKTPEEIAEEKDKNLKKQRFILPWCGTVTHRIARYLRTNLNVEIGYFPGVKLGSILSSLKEKEERPKCGIYAVCCKDPSCKALYIGETERDWRIRIGEHADDTKNNRVLKSAVALHMVENVNHHFGNDSVCLLEYEPRQYKRKFKESLYIQSLNDKMNTKSGVRINNQWCSTLTLFFKFNLYEKHLKDKLSQLAKF